VWKWQRSLVPDSSGLTALNRSTDVLGRGNADGVSERDSSMPWSHSTPDDVDQTRNRTRFKRHPNDAPIVRLQNRRAARAASMVSELRGDSNSPRP